MKHSIYSAIAILAVSVASQASALDIGGVSATSSGEPGGSSTGSSQVSAPAGINQSLPVGTNLESQLTNQQNQALQTIDGQTLPDEADLIGQAVFAADGILLGSIVDVRQSPTGCPIFGIKPSTKLDTKFKKVWVQSNNCSADNNSIQISMDSIVFMKKLSR